MKSLHVPFYAQIAQQFYEQLSGIKGEFFMENFSMLFYTICIYLENTLNDEKIK